MAASITYVGQLELSYDRDAGALHISVETPRKAYSYEDDPGLLLRKDPKNGEFVGATILDYEGALSSTSRPLLVDGDLLARGDRHLSPRASHSSLLTISRKCPGWPQRRASRTLLLHRISALARYPFSDNPLKSLDPLIQLYAKCVQGH